MKKTVGIFCVCAALSTSAQNALDAHDKRNTYMNTITVKELKEQLFVLAADDFEGRETSQPGQKKAAVYLENYYESLGLKKGSMTRVQQQSIP